MPPVPLILVSNDDGIHSDGLRALADAVAPHGRVVVVAPDREQSAVKVPPRWRRCKRHAATVMASVGASRFERPTTRTPSECATGLRHAPAFGLS